MVYHSPYIQQEEKDISNELGWPNIKVKKCIMLQFSLYLQIINNVYLHLTIIVNVLNKAKKVKNSSLDAQTSTILRLIALQLKSKNCIF